jgi:hypothetical protein
VLVYHFSSFGNNNAIASIDGAGTLGSSFASCKLSKLTPQPSHILPDVSLFCRPRGTHWCQALHLAISGRHRSRIHRIQSCKRPCYISISKTPLRFAPQNKNRPAGIDPVRAVGFEWLSMRYGMPLSLAIPKNTGVFNRFVQGMSRIQASCPLSRSFYSSSGFFSGPSTGQLATFPGGSSLARIRSIHSEGRSKIDERSRSIHQLEISCRSS